MLKTMVIKLLRHWAKRRLACNSKLIVVAVSGSAGKTSTKEAIALALAPYFPVLSSPKNYNNEFGVPLTVLEEETPARACGWLGVLRRAWRKSKQSLPYQAVVLEYGIDAPGDMQYLLGIAQPHVAVLTNIGTVHLQSFADKSALLAEKLALVKGLRPGGTAIINVDDHALRQAQSTLTGHVIGFGQTPKADVRFQVSDPLPARLVFQITLPTQGMISVRTQLLSQHQGYIISAALAVVHALGLDPAPAVQALEKLQAPAGRETLLAGHKNTLIIDSTYNSSPAACLAMLATLDEVARSLGRHPLPILGDMRELGPDELPAHCETIVRLAPYPLAILVGPAFGRALQELFPEGNPRHLHWFAHSAAVPAFLLDKLTGQECLLFKASQGTRLEKALQHCLANPDQAAKLLVRQEQGWQNR